MIYITGIGPCQALELLFFVVADLGLKSMLTRKMPDPMHRPPAIIEGCSGSPNTLQPVNTPKKGAKNKYALVLPGSLLCST